MFEFKWIKTSLFMMLGLQFTGKDKYSLQKHQSSGHLESGNDL